jgi:hypothetical protein
VSIAVVDQVVRVGRIGYVVVFGERLSWSELEAITGRVSGCIRARMHAGLPIEEAAFGTKRAPNLGRVIQCPMCTRPMSARSEVCGDCRRKMKTEAAAEEAKKRTCVDCGRPRKGRDSLRCQSCGCKLREASRTPEERERISKRARDQLTPEERSKLGKLGGTAAAKAMTPEHLEKFMKAAREIPKETRSEAARKVWNKLTPEQRSAILLKRWAEMTPKQRRKHSKAVSAGMRRRARRGRTKE